MVPLTIHASECLQRFFAQEDEIDEGRGSILTAGDVEPNSGPDSQYDFMLAPWHLPDLFEALGGEMALG